MPNPSPNQAGLIRMTPERGRQLAQRAHANRRALESEVLQLRSTVSELTSALARQPCQPERPPDNAFVSDRLTRVRTQLDRIDAMILTETDPQKLDRLAAAQERLSRQEHDLAGRPHAGNLRPTARDTRRTPPGTGPLCDDAPQA